MPSNPTCETCRWFDVAVTPDPRIGEVGWGVCKRHPPVLHTVSLGLRARSDAFEDDAPNDGQWAYELATESDEFWVQPRVSGREFCGEHSGPLTPSEPSPTPAPITP
jgi:hypothetical protein